MHQHSRLRGSLQLDSHAQQPQDSLDCQRAPALDAHMSLRTESRSWPRHCTRQSQPCCRSVSRCAPLRRHSPGAMFAATTAGAGAAASAAAGAGAGAPARTAMHFKQLRVQPGAHMRRHQQPITGACARSLRQTESTENPHRCPEQRHIMHTIPLSDAWATTAWYQPCPHLPILL